MGQALCNPQGGEQACFFDIAEPAPSVAGEDAVADASECEQRSA